MTSHLRFALRKLLRSPSFAALGILTLGIALAANVAIFCIVDRILLQPLPYANADRLVYVGHSAPGLDLPQLNISPRLYVHYRDHAKSFEAIGLFDDTSVSITGLEQPVEVTGAEVTPSILPILGVSPASGRAFTDAEGGLGAEPVVVLSHGFWQRRLGADPQILGSHLEVDGVSRQVIGIMAPGFDFPEPDVEVWLPMVVDPETAQLGSFGTEAVARLRDGVSLQQAQTELHHFASTLTEFIEGEDAGAASVLQRAGFDAVLEDFGDSRVGSIGPVLWILSATVGFVLLLAAFNVANLFLARAEQRQRETAVRSALGADPGALALTALFEGWALSLVAGGLGVVLATFGIRLLKRFGPQDVPRMHEVAVDARAAVFTLLLCFLCGLGFALLPMLRSQVRDLAAQLKDGGRSAAAGRQTHRVRRLLVAAQMGIAILLLIGAGLMGRSYLEVMKVDPGFDVTDGFTFRLSLPESRTPQEQVADTYERILDAVAAVPGVRSAASMTAVPLEGRHSASGFRLEFQDEDEMLKVFGINTVSPGFFTTLGIPILEGRTLERDDWRLRKPGVVVSQTLAHHYWPGQSAVGKRLFPGGRMDEGEDWYEIVGVAGDVRIDLIDERREMVYFSWQMPLEEQVTPRNQALAVRTELRPEAVADAVRQAVWKLDPNLPVPEIVTFDQLVTRARARTAFTTLMLLIAASVAVLLGAVGTYGVIAYLVAQRTGEIGVRLALGASRSNILGLVVREGLVVSAGGAAVGLAAAFFLSRGLESVLFQVAPRDPLTFLAVPILLLGVAVIACLVPARRAARTNPVVALRHE